MQNRWGHFSLTWSFYFISHNAHYFAPWNILWLLQIQTSSSCFRRSENKSFLTNHLCNRDERGALAPKWSSARFLHPNILFLAVFFHWCLTRNMQPHKKAPFSQTRDIWAGLGEVLWENKDLKCFYLRRLIQVLVSPHPQSHCTLSPKPWEDAERL